MSKNKLNLTLPPGAIGNNVSGPTNVPDQSLSSE